MSAKERAKTLKRRRTKGNNFLNNFISYFNEIMSDGLTLREVEIENGKFESWEEWKPTGKRHLYSIFEKLGSTIIDKNDLRRLKNITFNKIKLTHDQKLARSFLLILDSFASNVSRFKYSKMDYDNMKKTFPWSILLARDYKYFYESLGSKKESLVAKKYAKLAKILERLPDDVEFVKVSGLSKRQLGMFLRLESFRNLVDKIINSWHIPASEVLKEKSNQRYKAKRNRRTNKLTKELVVLIGLEFSQKIEKILHFDTKHTKELEDNYDGIKDKKKSIRKPES